MKQILCFGDSNTYGLIPGEKGRYPWEIRWTARLNDRLEKDGYRVIEEGLCGRTTVFADALRAGRRGADLLPVILESHTPLEMVILMLGTNDCKTYFGASASVIAKGMEQLVLQVRNFNPNIPILVISPIHLGENVWKPEFDEEFDRNSVNVSKELKEEFYKIAMKHHCYFLAASDVARPSEADQEHLDENGHAALAEAIYEKITTETEHFIRCAS